jgi:hypothetical protein
MRANFILWFEHTFYSSISSAAAHALYQVCLEHNDLAEFNKIQPFLRCARSVCAPLARLTGPQGFIQRRSARSARAHWLASAAVLGLLFELD